VNIEAVSASLRAGKSGVTVDEKRKELGFRSPMTGAIKDFRPHETLSRKQLKTMPDFAVQAYTAAMDAIAMSGLSLKEIRSAETGLVFGCDSSCLAAIEQARMVLEQGDTMGIGSGFIFRSMTSTVTMNLNTLLKTRGACWSISSACSSGGHAVGQAADLIALGRQERVICGGAQEINWESMCSFDAINAFSTRIDAPQEASRPFDKSRDGLVPGGGAAAILLERYDLAEKRGATILGEVLSYGFSSDGANLSVPSEEGISSAMGKALKNAGLEPSEIDYICAHATSTPLGDAVEASSISTVFGDKKPFVSSTKSMTGHELWMSGASQVVYSTVMAKDGFIAPNANFHEPDDSSAGLNIVRTAIPEPPRMVLCNSAGFGGTNSCLVLKFHA
jgi:3-oxoacyl-[acyl-carrier-protein] synthase-1